MQALCDLVQRYYRARSAKHGWPEEVRRRARGLSLTITDDFFFHMNPLYEPNRSMRYVVQRYEAAYDHLAVTRPHSVLEIGCAQGLSTWLMTSWADRVVGLDISEPRVAVGRHLFPEAEWVVDDWRAFLASGARFDVIVNSHGPVIWADEIAAACDHYIYIGYRTPDWRTTFTGAHKLSGRQLSFSTTLVGRNAAGRSARYPRYFLRRNWLKEARHALTHGYALPL